MPSGVEYKISLRDAREAHRAHLAGWSIRALARMRWEEWGYKSADSAAKGLRGVFRVLELPVRGQVEASILAHTIHGNDTQELRDPAHSEHGRYLSQRRHRRRRRREAAA